MYSNVDKTSGHWRGYCRVCNRYLFYKQNIGLKKVQLPPQQRGVCQSCRYDCAGVKDHVPSRANQQPDCKKSTVEVQTDSPVVYLWRGVQTDE